MTLELLDMKWKGPYHSLVISTLTLRRNLASYSFPHKLTSSERLKVQHLILDFLKVCCTFKPFSHHESLLPIEREYLFEHFFCEHPLPALQEGESLCVNSDILALINIDHHLQLHLVDPTIDLEASWQRLEELEVSLSKHLPLAFHPSFGFLGPEPKHCGISLRARLLLQLPALHFLGKQQKFLEQHLGELLSSRPMGSAEMGLLYVDNLHTLGVSETYLLNELKRFATIAENAELAAVKQLKKAPPIGLLDQCSRAYHLLGSSYQLDVFEALEALSSIRLAIQLEWLKGLSIWELNQWILKIQKGHLMLKECKGECNSDVIRSKSLKSKFLSLSLNLPVIS